MSKNKITKDTLWKLRNEVPIDLVILNVVKLPAQNLKGILRFQCPLCRNYHTATSDKTNLARCFECKQNFNPIDMVMQAGGMSFIDAVELLSRFLTS